MRRQRLFTVLAFIPAGAALAVGTAQAQTADKQTERFERVAPILNRCLRCHNETKTSGGLNLTSREAALKGGDNGPAVVPGDATKSLLYEMVASRKMPPKMPLSAGEIEAVKDWIAGGAVWDSKKLAHEGPRRAGPDWWSLQPVRRHAAPAVKDRSWLRNPIDAFVLAKLEHQGLSPAPPADRATLIRRASLDLLGLTPTPAEIDAFVGDPSPAAYERLVERLLASPHYGERWGRHWLDVARFGESQGFERDKIRDHAWRYRDYVIRSFNEDKPYDRFVREQIAGDQLSPPTREGIVATGFLVAGPWDEVGASQQSKVMRLRAREEELEDILSAVGQTFLGLTVNCARCHDHKFDPITQADYYRFKAAFDGAWPGDRPVLLPDELRAYEARVNPLRNRIAELEKRLRSQPPPTGLARLIMTTEIAGHRAALGAMPAVPHAYVATPRQPEATYVLLRGDVEKPGERVAVGGLSAIKHLPGHFDLPMDAPEGRRRLKLADWVAHSDNPLTARVLVNRIWHYHFGRGLVGTPNDFGFNGERPSHPELLEWLASEFVDPSPQRSPARREGNVRGWSMKQLHRIILLSNTYRQSGRFEARAAAIDADNRLLWRFAPRRLEGEAVRDAMLRVSGQLNPTLYGPSFRPFVMTIFNSHFYAPADHVGPEFNRRTVYRINVNSAKDALLDSLDCPDPSVKMPKRGTTTTPLQALGLMNNSFTLRQARCFAERLDLEAGADPARQVARAYRHALGRSPTGPEADRALALAKEHGLVNLCWVLFNSSEFLYLK